MKYTDLGTMPIALNNPCAVRMYNANMQPTNKIYIFGGRKYENGTYSNVNTIYEYNTDSNTYTLLNFTLPDAYRMMCGISFKNQIYLFGGIDSNNSYSHKIFTFDLTNGVVDTNVTTLSMTPRYAFLYDDSDREGTWVYPLIFLSDRSASYCVVDLSYSPITSQIITDTVTLSDVCNAWINNKVYSFTHNSTLEIYQIDDMGVGDHLYSLSIPETARYVEFIIATGIGEKVFFITRTASNDTHYRFCWEFDYETKELTQITSLNTTLAYQTGWGTETDYDGIIYLFGGWTYANPPSILPDLQTIDFNYLSVDGSYDSNYVDVSNTNNYALIGSRYENTFTPIDVTGYTELEFDSFTVGGENYLDQLEYNESTRTYKISINNLQDSIEYTILNSSFYTVTTITGDGVTLSGGSKWYQTSTYQSTITVDDGYTLHSVKVYAYDGTDITNNTYDSSTNTISLNLGMWGAYRNVTIKVFANTTDLKVTLYRNNSNSNTVNKDITEIATVSGYLRDETSILTPSLIIDTTDDSNYVMDANYVYIPNFRRYYYISSISSVRTHLWRINLRVDVLMSFKDQILSNTCLISRSASVYNPYLPDAEVVIESDPFISVEEIKNDILKQGTGMENFLITTVS